MNTQATPPRPSDAEIDHAIASARRSIMTTVRTSRRPSWRRMSRLGAIVTAAAVIGGAAGAAVASKRLFADPPRVETGNTVLTLGEPAPSDRWLNVQMRYTCRQGERFTVTVGSEVVLDEDCDAMYYNYDGTDSDPGRGVAKSIPVDDVHGRTVTVDSTLSHDYRVEATFSPVAEMRMLVLPDRGDDGNVDWDTPDYEVNEYGLTVGTPRLNTPENQWPDLVPTWFEGREAYFLGSDYNEGVPLNPKAAVERERQRERDGLIDRKTGTMYRRVYAADGKTVLGKVETGTFSKGE